MSEEVASAFVERRAFEAAMAERDQWRDVYERIEGAFILSMEITACHQVAGEYAGIVYDLVLSELAERNDQIQAQLAASHEQIAILEAERRRLLVIAYEAYELSLHIEEFDAVVDSSALEALDSALMRAFGVADLIDFSAVAERITTALGGYAAMLEARKA